MQINDWSHTHGVTTSASNPADIANLLNYYFYSVFKSSDSNDAGNFSSIPSDSSIGTLGSLISSITLNPEDVYHVLATLDENKATGPDKITAKLLKNCAPSICFS